MKRGFTLVELAIVLVIIGLIIGGILAAQSMMDTARLNNQIIQFQQFDVAASNFRTKYGALPGDTAKIPPATGNEDGVVGAFEGGFGGEFAQFWAQLANTGMLSGNITYSTAAIGGRIFGGSQLPYAKITKILIGNPIGDLATTDGPLGVLAYSVGTTNYYGITAPVPVTQMGRGLAITPAAAAALDQKMDDGNGATGRVTEKGRSSLLLDVTEAVKIATSGGSFAGLCTDVNGKYLVANSYCYHCGCTPRIEMLSSGEGQ